MTNLNAPVPPRHLKAQRKKQQNQQFCPIANDVNDDTQSQRSQSERQHTLDQRRVLYKTELCREWMASGWCYYEKRCSFAHSVNELRPVARSKKWRTKRCRNWHTTGYCPYQHRCQFLHSQAPSFSHQSVNTTSPMPSMPMQSTMTSPQMRPPTPVQNQQIQQNIRHVSSPANTSSTSIVNQMTPPQQQRPRSQPGPIANGPRASRNYNTPQKKVTQRVSLPASMNQNSRNPNERTAPVYFHYNVEAKAAPNGSPPRLRVTPYVPNATNVDMSAQRPPRVDGVAERGNAKLQRNLQTMSLSQTEKQGLTVELPSSLTPSIASDNDGDDDLKDDVINDTGSVPVTDWVDSATDHQLHVKLTEQRRKLQTMQSRVNGMALGQSDAKLAHDDDDRKDNGAAAPVLFADMLQYMLPDAYTPIVMPPATFPQRQPLPPFPPQTLSFNSMTPVTPRGRVSLPSQPNINRVSLPPPPHPPTMIPVTLDVQSVQTPRGPIAAVSDYTPRGQIVNLPFNFSCSPSPSMFSQAKTPNLAPHTVVSLPPSAVTVPQPMASPATLSRLDNTRKAQFIAAQFIAGTAAQNQIGPIRAVPIQTVVAAAPTTPSAAATDPMMFPTLNLSAFDASLSFSGSADPFSLNSMSPDLPPIPDPSQYLSFLN